MQVLILKPNTNDVFFTRKDVMKSWNSGELFKQQNLKQLRLMQDEHLSKKDLNRIADAGYEFVEFVNSKDETVGTYEVFLKPAQTMFERQHNINKNKTSPD